MKIKITPEMRIRLAYAESIDIELQSGWQPIETAPRDGTIVDLWRDGERLTEYKWTQLSPGNGFFSPVSSGYCCVRNATHWMPLPEPPK